MAVEADMLPLDSVVTREEFMGALQRNKDLPPPLKRLLPVRPTKRHTDRSDWAWVKTNGKHCRCVLQHAPRPSRLYAWDIPNGVIKGAGRVSSDGTLLPVCPTTADNIKLLWHEFAIQGRVSWDALKHYGPLCRRAVCLSWMIKYEGLECDVVFMRHYLEYGRFATTRKRHRQAWIKALDEQSELNRTLGRLRIGAWIRAEKPMAEDLAVIVEGALEESHLPDREWELLYREPA